MHNLSPHSFHIPVMGLAYTIDSPVKVARFGISSVVSIIEDNLIEKMRSYYYCHLNETYHPISAQEDDYRAKRITDYLNLLNRIVQHQMEKLKNSAFEAGSELVKYFEMLPDEHRLKLVFKQMGELRDQVKKKSLGEFLKSQLQAGSIDVNIMTKVDKINTDSQGNPLEDGSDALTALRGYVRSCLTNSSVVLSAGMNPRLFNYMEKLKELRPNSSGGFDKKIVIKVSDYRSAIIQGKYLAKKGLWVSEFRIESGLNCGGHAFATDGYLLGPILDEFKVKREELQSQLSEISNKALEERGEAGPTVPLPLTISVQGGIGTSEEDCFLRRHYGVDSTGWGTPFLLVPEATTVDEETLQLLSKAGEKDVILSRNSPLGIRFHYLKGTSAEKEKLARIEKGKPGSPCTEKYLVSNIEFTEEPICTASHKYQKLKLAHLKSQNIEPADYEKEKQQVLDKECLCIGLSNSAVQSYKLTPFKRLEAVTICPGPNIVNFSKIVPLKTMVDHIYGRTSLVDNRQRPHMFIKELHLYINYLKEVASGQEKDLSVKQRKYNRNFYDNLLAGIAFYRKAADQINKGITGGEESFLHALGEAEYDLMAFYDKLIHRFEPATTV